MVRPLDDRPPPPTAPPVPVAGGGFEAFFHDEYPALVAVAQAMLGSRDAADDVAQETMRRAYERWDTIGAYERPGAWTRRVAINLCISGRRRRRAEAIAVSRLRRRPDTDPMDAVDGRDRFDRLVAGLPPRQRAAVVGVYLADFSVAEVADTLGCAPGTIKSQLHDARRTLATRLDPG